MNKRGNFLTGFAVFGMVFALLFASVFTACDPIEGNIDEIRQKAEGGRYVPPPDTTVYYTVTFDSKGGSTIEQQRVREGEYAINPTPPTWPNNSYSFAGWYTDESFTNKYLFDTQPTQNFTLYARWSNITVFTVYFQYNDGRPVEPQNVVQGEKVVSPVNPTRRGYIFDGWYSNETLTGLSYNFNNPVIGALILYAKWAEVSEITDIITEATGYGTGLAAKFNWLASNYLEGKEYTISANIDESLDPRTLSTSGGYSNYKVNLNGSGGVRTISFSSNGSMFTVGSGVTLSLGNIILQGPQGHVANTDSLVTVNSGGELVMNSGSRITDNVTTSGTGGGVYVAGKLTMKTDSAITDNGTGTSAKSPRGGGVCVAATGTFAMEGGTISGNSANSVDTKNKPLGAGVFVTYGGSFIKTGGVIYGYSSGSPYSNTVRISMIVQTGNGHAVYVISTPSKFRDTTAGSGVDLDSSTSDNWVSP